ncbi:MAG TPA: hypothetical protein VJV03_01755 [Pyrinomonadaceae bacterium]|nr:hypothetical protein [Pyrinomonadaceae bacterium]
MKRCPTCNRTYTDTSLNFCLEDGTPLVAGASPMHDPNATIRYGEPPDTNPPPTEIYRQPAPLLNQVDVSEQPRQWVASPSSVPRKKSNAVWWILGGVVVAGLIVVGVAVMILALASIGSNSNGNTNTNVANTRNTNTRTVNRNANVTNVNSTSSLPATTTDDFSESTWSAGKYTFGEVWYDNEQYHMRSKAKTYLVMYAPSNDFNTENATVRVTVRSVDGTPANSGFGLIVHGDKSRAGSLEDYGLLIYTGPEAKYEIIKHKNGVQSTVVPWTRSTVIRTGTNPNQLEIRARGLELSFYINGQYIDRITDSENFRRGVAGLYTSDSTDVAFDDLEIRRQTGAVDD